jgi:hypothetical protein
LEFHGVVTSFFGVEDNLTGGVAVPVLKEDDIIS